MTEMLGFVRLRAERASQATNAQASRSAAEIEALCAAWLAGRMSPGSHAFLQHVSRGLSNGTPVDRHAVVAALPPQTFHELVQEAQAFSTASTLEADTSAEKSSSTPGNAAGAAVPRSSTTPSRAATTAAMARLTQLFDKACEEVRQDDKKERDAVAQADAASFKKRQQVKRQILRRATARSLRKRLTVGVLQAAKDAALRTYDLKGDGSIRPRATVKSAAAQLRSPLRAGGAERPAAPCPPPIPTHLATWIEA